MPQDASESMAVEEHTEAPVEDQAVVETTEESADDQEQLQGLPPSLPRLVVKRNGAETEESFEFNPPATIGRFDPDIGPIDIDLGSLPEGQYVSRKHAKIVSEDGVYKICDLGSSNGTYVLRDDFERVDEAEISDGTEIALGNARFVFHT
ncbi:MAG: FHA domain-containing protein [Armatimonadetes bacterium]|nr:FHA domain-containing protein [Armatimonadota bacterium]